MTDPLSIAASVATLVAITKPIIKRLKVFKGAQQELELLLVEVRHFDDLLQAIRSGNLTDENWRIKTLLDDAKDVLLKINVLVQYTLTEAGTDDKVDRLQWTRKRDDVERLTKSLRKVCANMVAIIGVQMW